MRTRFCPAGHDKKKVGIRKINYACLACELIRGRKNDAKRSKSKRRIAWRAKYNPKYLAHAKKELFRLLGDKCACCGETEPLFLTIDHINNDGHKEPYRLKTLYYLHVRDNPKQKKYQILCWNCNGCKRVNGGRCIH